MTDGTGRRTAGGGAWSGGELDAVRADLASLAERLADLAYEELRRAVADGEGKRPELERRLTRARGAVERALAILRDTADGDGDGDGD
jgi:hypothetical protein